MAEEADNGYKSIEFMAKSGVSHQVWKETEPELTNLFERNFDGFLLMKNLL